MAKPRSAASRPTRTKGAPRRRGRDTRRKRVVAVTAGLLVTGAAVIGLLVSSPDSSLKGRAADRGPSGTLRYEPPVLGREHVAGKVRYRLDPPVGGNHNIVAMNCGFYRVSVPNENGVHSLEHGAVWITYKNTVPPASLDALAAIARAHPYVLVSRYDDMPTPIALSAWGYQLRLDNAEDPRLAEFLTAFENGPQTPEPGASCSGGTGTPER